MFHRQSTEEALQSLFPIKVYPDGRCLFRSVASRLEQRLLQCPRNDVGAPIDATLFELEKNLADLLRESTVNVLKSNLPFFYQLDDAVLLHCVKKKVAIFIIVFLRGLNICLNLMNMPGPLKYLVSFMAQIVQYIFIINQMESLSVE